MAVATFKFNPKSNVVLGEDSGDCIRYFGTITFSAAADTYATGGMSPVAAFDAKSLGPYADRDPILVVIQSLRGSGYEYFYNTATKKLMIIAGGGSGTAAPVELTNGTALNAATPNIFTDVLAFELVFPKGTN